ncbi:MAG: hypothetical protein RL689_1896, partial [Planctomycetota bacterium]
MHHALARLAARRLTCRAGLRPALEPHDPRTLLAADQGIEQATSLPSIVVPRDNQVLAARVNNR